LVVAANCTLALIGIVPLSPRDQSSARRPALLAALIMAILLGCGYVWGSNRSLPPAGRVCVAAIQPGREIEEVGRYMTLWSVRDWSGLAREIVPDMAVLTREAAAEGAELIVWPEAVLWLDPQADTWTGGQLANLARETGAALVVPYFVLTPEGRLSWWLGRAQGMRNEAVLITPGGQFLEASAKDHPIPFIGERSSTRGLYSVHSLAFGQVGTMLGYDTAFTDTARRLARQGSQVLTLSTHDWVGMSAAYGRHTVLRAVENGVAIVKADWKVGSLIVDARGRILAEAPSDRATEALLVAEIPLPRAGSTAFARVGDLLGYVSLVGLVVWIAAGRFLQEGGAPRPSEGSPKPDVVSESVRLEPGQPAASALRSADHEEADQQPHRS
jgi:apolipoprotein N-acyltransferase